MLKPSPVMSRRDKALALLVATLWAYNVVAVKQGVAELPPLVMTTLRFAIVAILIVPFTRVTLAQLPSLLAMSFTFGLVHFGLLFVALSLSEAGTGAILVQLGTPIAMVMACVFLREKLRFIQVFGICCSLAGVLVLAGGPTLPPLNALILLLLSATGWATTNIISKRGPPIHPLTMAGWLSLFALPQVAFASWLTEVNQIGAVLHASWWAWGSVIYSALGSSILAYSLWYWLLSRYDVNQVMPFSLLSPPIAVAFGVLLLNDSLNLLKLLGGAMIISGIAIASLNLRRIRRR